MKQLSQFLERFKKLKPSGSVFETETKKIIQEVCGLEEGEYKIFYERNNLIIQANSSVLKNEVFLKKEKILNELKKRLQKEQIPNLFFK